MNTDQPLDKTVFMAAVKMSSTWFIFTTITTVLSCLQYNDSKDPTILRVFSKFEVKYNYKLNVEVKKKPCYIVVWLHVCAYLGVVSGEFLIIFLVEL